MYPRDLKPAALSLLGDLTVVTTAVMMWFLAVTFVFWLEGPYQRAHIEMLVTASSSDICLSIFTLSHRQQWKVSFACAERLQPDAEHWPVVSLDSWGAWDAENNPLPVYVLPLLTWPDLSIDLLSTQWASSTSVDCAWTEWMCVFPLSENMS